jgi:hypothetical protein
MASLRVKVELNKGGVGVSLHKLAQVSSQYERFLKSFSRDLHLDLKNGEWVAKDFENSSVDFVVEYIGPATQDKIEESKVALRYVMKETNNFTDLSSKISRDTILSYARIAKDIDADEAVGFGLYDNGNTKPDETYILSKQRALTIEEALSVDDRIEYIGSLQGKIHSLFKEVDRPHFNIREIATNNLIECFYSPEVYDQLAEALKKKDAMVFISGQIVASRATRKPLYIRAEKIHTAEEYQEGDLDKFFGCAPDITGELSTDDFIDTMRRNDR